MKIPVLTSSFYFQNCLEEDVLDAFPSIWSWIESFTLMWLISTCKLSTRCFERAKIVFLQVTHFRKKVVNQIVICSFLYSKCLFEKILHLITEIILTPSSSFLGEDIGQRVFIFRGEFSTSFWWSPLISMEHLWYSSHLQMASVTNFLVFFSYYVYISYQKEWNLFVPHCWINFLKKTQASLKFKFNCSPFLLLCFCTLHLHFFWNSKEMTEVKRKLI